MRRKTRESFTQINAFRWILVDSFFRLTSRLFGTSQNCKMVRIDWKCSTYNLLPLPQLVQSINQLQTQQFHTFIIHGTHTLAHHPPRKLLELYSLRLRFFFFLNFNSVLKNAVHELLKLKMIAAEKNLYCVHVCTRIAFGFTDFSIFTLSTGEFLPMTNGWSKWLRTLKRRKAHANGHLIRWAVLHFLHGSIAFVWVLLTHSILEYVLSKLSDNKSVLEPIANMEKIKTTNEMLTDVFLENTR